MIYSGQKDRNNIIKDGLRNRKPTNRVRIVTAVSNVARPRGHVHFEGTELASFDLVSTNVTRKDRDYGLAE